MIALGTTESLAPHDFSTNLLSALPSGEALSIGDLATRLRLPESIVETELKMRPYLVRQTADQTYELAPPSEWKISCMDDFVLQAGESVHFLAPGLIAKGCSTLLVAFSKVGKTTWLSHLMAGRVPGVRLGLTLLVTEEGPPTWGARVASVGPMPDAWTVSLPFLGKPSLDDWKRFITWIVWLVQEFKIDCVIIDTLFTLGPVKNENDAGEVDAALSPLRQITAAGAALVLSHHSKKGETIQGQAARGSSVLTAFPDLIVEMRPYESLADPRRKFIVLSRLSDIEGEQVWRLDADGYKVIGKVDAVRESDLRAEILRLLSGGGLTLSDILIELESSRGDTAPSKSTVQRILCDGYSSGTWNRTGAGTKGDPYRYQAPSRPLDA